ncbi:5-demethoxyubiquinol-8 5-hydroxylase UbiM [Chromohalobacter nigrandesensis]|uniref:5-demethoxyubiquinol-8 5-hydroxylase UbiM n=1 Tax=Chromohalobacter nigrandesensis TaxID=119863 RepID=UPI001FF3F193|nr:5-demethoxyubiquinol-8 5-hydroxylase UbiM [Chromohalobacter nigrandesensis]MCK0745254.1 5-demethoxyubiquinol-8 5-hydroxylase UbiM [Chromohalobacter nigrandesensis]
MSQPIKDVAIVGAGPVGMSLAMELAALDVSVTLIDAAPCTALASPDDDGREIALTHASRKQLTAVGIDIPAGQMAPIREARLYNGASSRGMTLASARGEGEDSIGQLVANHVIRRAAFEAVQGSGRIELVTGRRVSALGTCSGGRSVLLDDQSQITARLVVAADGRLSATRRLAGLSAQVHDTGQRLLVRRMAHTRPHREVTWSWFNGERGLALLPLAGDTASLVMTLPPHQAERLKALSAEAFATEATRLYRNSVGEMRCSGALHDYPLVVSRADHLVADRVALVGDAAVGLHPVTAHGFNVGLASVRRLVEALTHHDQAVRDVGAPAQLAIYARHHQRAILPLWHASRALVTLYGDTRPPARLVRHLALGAARRAAPLQWLMESYLARH